MSFTKKTIRDIDLDHKAVLVGVDFNLPGDSKGNVTDAYRIEKALPTLEYLLKQDCRIFVVSHRGRPKGHFIPEFSLKPVAEKLAQLMKREVAFATDCVGRTAETAKAKLPPGRILVLENTRFHSEEEKNDAAFAQALAAGADVFVQDAFGNAHRKHASTDAVTRYLPSVAGLLLEKEVDIITDVMKKPRRPLMAIIGGAKIADKIDLIHRFIELADVVAVGGAMANTFLLAEGIKTGKSLTDKDDVPFAKDIMDKARAEARKRHFIFYLPQDGVVANKLEAYTQTRIVDWSAHIIADIEYYPTRPPHEASQVKANEMILDVGPFSGAFMAGSMQLANTVVWNGTLGVAETPASVGGIGPFAHGTELVVEAMLGQFGHRPFSLVGGGDTVSYLEQRRMTTLFDHVSTGGGASLELMAGQKLPGVEALQDK